MHGFYLTKKYKKEDITLIFNFKTKTWYIPRNDIVRILYNPTSPSSYWGHLKTKYLKQDIDINKSIRKIKGISKDKKEHHMKVIPYNTCIKLIKILDSPNSKSLIIYLKKLEEELNTLSNKIK